MQSIHVEAKTVEEAIGLACRQLQASREQLSIEVIEQGPGWLLSLFSDKKAKIRATLKGARPADAVSRTSSGAAQNDALNRLKNNFERIIREIDSRSSIQIRSRHDEEVFTIISDGSGIFIGKKGQTLEALQYLLNKMRLRAAQDLPHIIVDSEGYRSRHIENLENLARRLSEKAKQKGGPVTTSPLNAADRRVIHMALKKDTELTTWSKGEGGMRKVIIAPRQ